MIIMDREGNYWPSNSERFSKLNISEAFIQDICGKVDDGAEPIITQSENCSIVATQLATNKTNCGYVLLFLPKYNPESTLANADLLEMLLNQMNLIAKLVEKNCQLYELKTKYMPGTSAYMSSEAASN